MLSLHLATSELTRAAGLSHSCWQAKKYNKNNIGCYVQTASIYVFI